MSRKSIRGLAAGVCVAAALAAGPAMAKSPGHLTVPVEEFTLPNGLHVILHEDHTVPIVHTNIWYLVGSSYEVPGKTGFAHLFEHLMFEGSGHVAEGEFDHLLETVGGNNNASTSKDRTNYYTTVPSTALELPLFLESDRMGYLLDKMTPDVVDNQRDVVKNEMRQSYLNRPYGRAWLEVYPLMYPEGHPYHWPVIGSMDDLSAAGYDDVAGFFKKFYVPNNASLVIAGDIDMAQTKQWVTKWFSDVKRGEPVVRPQPEPVALDGVKTLTMTDKVSLPARILLWHSPAYFAEGDADLDIVAAVLADAKTSRLCKRLVYEEQIAQSVSASQSSARLGSLFTLSFIPKPGHTLDEIQKIVDEEIVRLQNEPPTQRELDLIINGLETSLYHTMERLFTKSDRLNMYYWNLGKCDSFAYDLQRYHNVTPASVQAAAKKYLPIGRRAELSVMPEEAK